jgi:hypothetical protein
MRPVGKPRYLLAIYEQGQWADAGVFGSAREVEIEQTVVVAQAVRESDVQIVQLKAGEESVAVVAQLKRAFVISRSQPSINDLLVGFSLSNANPNLSRKPRFKQDADIEQAVRFETMRDAQAALAAMKAVASSAIVSQCDWRER